MVWANSLGVGCGAATCSGNLFLVCDYSPPGNYIGETPFPVANCQSCVASTAAGVQSTAATKAQTTQPPQTTQQPPQTTQPHVTTANQVLTSQHVTTQVTQTVSKPVGTSSQIPPSIILSTQQAVSSQAIVTNSSGPSLPDIKGSASIISFQLFLWIGLMALLLFV